VAEQVGNDGDKGIRREQIVELYRDRARHYDRTAQLYYLVGHRQRTYRRKAVGALQLEPGATVVEVGCGTGLNFPLLEEKVGPEGQIVGIDLTDAMLARARRRVEARGWQNVSLMQADAVEFEFPTGVDAILSTYALSLVPDCAEVIDHGAAALSPGGRLAVLDLKPPDNAPPWLGRIGLATVRPFGVTAEWMARRPWDEIRRAMETSLSDVSWTDLYWGFTYLAAGSRFAHD